MTGPNSRPAALLVLLAGTAGARIIATDFRAATYELLDRCVMVMMAKVAIWAMNVVVVMGVIVIMVAVRTMNMGVGGCSLRGFSHGRMGLRWLAGAIAGLYLVLPEANA